MGVFSCYLDNIISIHALLAESDNKTTKNNYKKKKFLSTLSLRRATILGNPCAGCPDFYPRSPCGERRAWMGGLSYNGHFYPRSPCGERLWADTNYNLSDIISIHALLAESDSPVDVLAVSALPISIHALLAESDRAESGQRRSPDNFYPRSPCGERRPAFSGPLMLRLFLSTLSLRRATTLGAAPPAPQDISIHALLAESDICNASTTTQGCHFYPRSPCGERLVHLAQAASPGGISIHALLAESDLEQSSSYSAYLEISIHALLAESDSRLDVKY